MPRYFQQPLDPDAPSALRSALPTARQIGGVWAGGAIGCGLRALVELALPLASGFPWATLLVNLLGAFALALLLELLLLAGDDYGVRRRLRLALGTGLLGGFTTYSTFAVESVDLLRAGAAGTAFAYVALTLTAGTLLAFAGIAAAQRIRSRA